MALPVHKQTAIAEFADFSEVVYCNIELGIEYKG